MDHDACEVAITIEKACRVEELELVLFGSAWTTLSPTAVSL